MFSNTQSVVSEFWTSAFQVGETLSKHRSKTGSRNQEGEKRRCIGTLLSERKPSTSAQSIHEDVQAELHQTAAHVQKGLSSKIIILPTLLWALLTSFSFSLCFIIKSSPPKSTTNIQYSEITYLFYQKD